MIMFDSLFRYIFLRTLAGVAIAAGAVCLAIVLVDLVEQMRAVAGLTGATGLTALQLTLMRLPGILEQALPFAVLVGTIMAFVQLSRKSEIIAMRAAGLSAWRFLAPAAALAALTGLASVLVLGPVGARLNIAYDALKDRLEGMHTEAEADGSSRIWRAMRSGQGQVVISGRPDGSPGRLSEVTFLILPDDPALPDTRIDAVRATLEGGSWVVADGVESRAGQPPMPFAQRTVAVNERTGERQAVDARALGLFDLPAAAATARDSGGSPGRYELRFQRLLASPLSLVAMTLLAALLSLGVDRLGGRTLMVAIALGTGLVIHFSNDIAAGLATAGLVQVWAAAWCPPLLSLAAVLGLISLREDA